MAAAWTGMLAGSPSPGRSERYGVLMLSSGLPDPLFNPAFVLSPPSDRDATLSFVLRHYGSMGAPFALYFRDEVVAGLADACVAAGLVEHWRPPLMVLDPVPPGTSRCPAGLDVTRLDASNVGGYASVLAAGFAMPRQLVYVLLARSMLDRPNFIGFLGTAGGQPVATAAVFLSEHVAGIYNVAAVPESRGNGFGAALTWVAARAGRDAGARCSVLQSSEQGEPVYRAMGYATPTRYRQFEPPPA